MGNPRGGQFDGQRQPVETLANRRDIRSVGVAQTEIRTHGVRAGDEEAHGR